MFGSQYLLHVDTVFKSPVAVGETFFIPSIYSITTLRESNEYSTISYKNYSVSMQKNGNDVKYSSPFVFDESGIYKLTYSGVIQNKYQQSGGSGTIEENFSFSYTFQVVENRYPLKKQTIKEVIERILDVAEPLVVKRNDDNTATYVKPPRFKFEYKHPEDTEDGKAERALFNQTAPEFTFTRMTLREVLQEIGKFIHAEPRLTKNGTTWIYDRYGEQTLATYRQNGNGEVTPLNQHPYKGKRSVYDIGVACTKIESDVDNFVNRLDKVGGTITEPYRGGALSLRTDNAYLRLEDKKESGTSGLYFPTSEPIMDVTSFHWVDVSGLAGTAGARYNLTPYIFEKTIYDAELSSYDTKYPRSKAYGLYFAQGQKNINGFFFKNEEWSNGVLTEYAITNILREVTNKRNLNFSLKYPELCFELTYTPTYGARLTHGKSYTGDMLKKPFTLMYNQSANVVETRYYGEHLKGVAERLGNVEKTVSIYMRNVGNVPKIGQMWDEDYYISSVKGSVVPDGIALEIGLSKKFNRLSEYVGANSYKRYYEVSERMSQDRRTLYKDYLIITNQTIREIPSDCFITESAFSSVANVFYQSESGNLAVFEGDPVPLVNDIVSCVSAQGFSKTFNPSNAILLPVISSAFGNTMEYTWSFKDNYSAGISSTYQENGKSGKDKVTGYFGAEVTYGDYYGREYYQRFALQIRGGGITLDKALALPNDFTDAQTKTVFGAPEEYYRVLRKDSREVLNQSYSVEYVTDIKNIVIGSALSRNNPTIGGINPKADAVLYILPERVNQFSNDDIDLTNATAVYEYKNDLTSSDPQIKLSRGGGLGMPILLFKGVSAPVKGKSWAIISKRYEGDPYQAENENGDVETIVPQYGGELLLAWNGDIAAGDTVGEFNIVAVHDIFDIVNPKN